MTNEHGFSATRYLVKKYVGFLPSDPLQINPEVRARCGRLEAWTSILINMVLFAGKGLLGILMNSISMMADAVHCASDVITSVLVLVGFKLSASPPDEKHPFGHGRAEVLCTLVIAIMLVLVACGFLRSSYQRFRMPVPVMGSWLVAGLSLASAVVKEWMTRFAIFLGKAVDAQVLIADGWHHRTDAIASVLVAIAMVASKYGYFRVDAILGIVVSIFIAYMGVDIARTSSSRIIGERASDETMQFHQILSDSVKEYWDYTKLGA